MRRNAGLDERVTSLRSAEGDDQMASFGIRARIRCAFGSKAPSPLPASLGSAGHS
ncbi:MAG: hypothetical protein M0C28_18750 [Candidatus Moduliflexus flocculans]|nr:hypothetical protein [Candidatus Moduliflexus flocculans]